MSPCSPLAPPVLQVQPLPLSVSACNAQFWAPRRDYSNGRITRSPLQLAPGTLMLVDETVGGERGGGQVGARGGALG